MLQAPDFWARPGFLSDLLAPLGWAFAAAGTARRRFTTPFRANVPVLCVGNLVAGGAGKTPVCLSLAQIIIALGKRPHILSRGYGGNLAGPALVDPARHTAADVGDEPLLLARVAPCWIGADRVVTARAAVAAGAELLLLDDGFQNPHLHQDLAFAVIDAAYGLGNGRVMPAGPLREPASTGLARAHAVVLMGNGKAVPPALPDKTVLRARLVPRAAEDLKGKSVVAFAGIGEPRKFFATLTELGAELVATHAYPDHHPYRDTELAHMAEEAAQMKATLVTTEKDLMRLAPAWRQRVRTLAVDLVWEDQAALMQILAPIIGASHE